MPTYKLTDPASGKTVRITGDTPPTEQELEQIFSSVSQAPTSAPAEQPKKDDGFDWQGYASDILKRSSGYVRPVAQAVGTAVGTGIGAGAGTLGLPGPGTVAGGVTGAALGYAAGNQLADAIEGYIDPAKSKTLAQAASQVPNDVATGAMLEMGGQVAGKALSAGAGLVGKGIKQTLGATTGSGPGAIDEAVNGSKAFTDTMRGKVTGDEVVDNVRSALSTIKENRAAAYTEKLAGIESNAKDIDVAPIRTKLDNLMKRYNIKVMSDGSLDTSRIAMGKTGRNDVEEIVNTVNQWGSQKGDKTAMGLDTLKRQLDDFYSDSSQARQFVTEIRNAVKNTISKEVPEYAEMTQGYTDATKLIKDIESGLMLRKQGMTGRVTGDMTLRRLTSAMRENNELRKDLLSALGKEAGQDLTGQVAGYAMSDLVPRGLVGKALGSGAGYLTYLNPKLWPLLAASSPRAVGEFLNVYGKAINSQAGKAVKSAAPAIRKTAQIVAGEAVRPSVSMPDIASTAEAATLSDYARGADNPRTRALREAAGDEPTTRTEIPQAGAASDNSVDYGSTMSKADRMIEEQRRRQSSERAPKAERKQIPVRQFVQEGELRYRDNRGNIYLDDPNDFPNAQPISGPDAKRGKSI